MSSEKRTRGPTSSSLGRKPEDGLSVLRLPLDVSDRAARTNRGMFGASYQVRRAGHAMPAIDRGRTGPHTASAIEVLPSCETGSDCRARRSSTRRTRTSMPRRTWILHRVVDVHTRLRPGGSANRWHGPVPNPE